MLNRFLIFLNNYLAAFRCVECRPEEALVIVPRCLQNRACNRDLIADANSCRRCGRCSFGALVDLCGEFGVRVAMAGGGRQACELARQDGVRSIVAVACEKELAAGILSVLTKRIYAIPNSRPSGPCVDTDVELERVRRVLERTVCHGE